MEKNVKKIIEESIAVKKKLAQKQYARDIARIADIISDAFKKSGKLILCGNGGSAADSQHIAAEFIGRFQTERRSLPAISLTTNTSSITAIANDYDYRYIFSRQVSGLAKSGDVLMAISTSGNAVNVIEAAKEAKRLKLKTVALTGNDGGGLARICDISIIVPSEITARIQEAHITIGHIICELVEKRFK